MTLTVSKAPDQVSVPDVTGQAADAAKSAFSAEPYTFDGHRDAGAERRRCRQHRAAH